MYRCWFTIAGQYCRTESQIYGASFIHSIQCVLPEFWHRRQSQLHFHHLCFQVVMRSNVLLNYVLLLILLVQVVANNMPFVDILCRRTFALISRNISHYRSTTTPRFLHRNISLVSIAWRRSLPQTTECSSAVVQFAIQYMYRVHQKCNRLQNIANCLTTVQSSFPFSCKSGKFYCIM